jgi:hypothetical protein
MRIDFTDDANVLAAASDRCADNLFGAAFGVHLRRVDQIHTEIQTETKSVNLGFSSRRIFTHPPSSLADHGHL